MLKRLINKIPHYRICKWNTHKEERNKFLKESSEDVDIVEEYIFEYNMFMSRRQILYVQMNIFYGNKKILYYKLRV